MHHFKLNDKFEQTFVVTDGVFNGFTEIFNDRNGLHVDEQHAIDHGFKGRVMHGNILNGFLSYFIGECLPTKNVIILSQEIQFKHPCYLDDELLFKATVTGIFESVNAIEFKYSFENNESKVVAKGKIQIGLLT